jgi:uncharacterized membrane protein YhiD involved in acid resistance
MHEILPRLLVAVAIGAVLASRPWRRLMNRPSPKLEMVQTQILLCAAAAVITAVIGNSVAKAFGLVGLGGFVRFRSGLKDPRDAAILFLMIGLGMACGHGSLELAVAGTGFVAVLLVVLDLLSKHQRPVQRLRLEALSDDLPGAEQTLRHALGEKNVLVTSCALDFAGRKVELEVEERVPGSVARALASGATGLHELKWMTLQSKKSKEEWV